MPELIQRKNFDSPDERDTPWDKVHGDWVELLGEEIGRMTVEPGCTSAVPAGAIAIPFVVKTRRGEPTTFPLARKATLRAPLRSRWAH